MDWFLQMKQALEYIENNLSGEIDNKELSQITLCSPYHFQRVFSYMSGVTLSEYVRRRRLASAAFELQNSDIKVIDLALKYGYDSPTAFNRAFRNMHGVAPNAAREQGVILKAYPPISFHISIKGAVEMDYKIVDKESFRAVGIRLHTTMENEEGFSKVPAFWGENTQNGNLMKVAQLMNKEPFGLLGVSVCNETGNEMWNNSEFDYYIAASTDQAIPVGMEEVIIPAATWAVFECIGPVHLVLQDFHKRIVTEWLPTSGYEYAYAPDIEVYLGEDPTTPDYKTQVWLPVKKKA